MLQTGQDRENGVTTTTLADWREWQERCALGRCRDEVQLVLRRFGAIRFRCFLERCRARRTGRHTPPMPSDTDAWHLLETHMTIPGIRNGKRYKDWLFARAHSNGDVQLVGIEGGATLLLRTAVRRYIADETPPHGQRSLDAALGSDAGGFSLGDLLASGEDPLAETQSRELAGMARQQAADTFEDVPARIRVALAAKHRQQSLAHPAVTAAAGCGKSVLRESYRRFLVTLFKRLIAAHPDEDRQMQVELAVHVVEDLQRRAGRTELRSPGILPGQCDGAEVAVRLVPGQNARATGDIALAEGGG